MMSRAGAPDDTNFGIKCEKFLEMKNRLIMTLYIGNSGYTNSEYSPDFVIDGKVIFRMRSDRAYNNHTGNVRIISFAQFSKIHSAQPSTYIVNFTCKQFVLKNKQFSCDNDVWYLLDDKNITTYDVDISITEKDKTTEFTFAPLHDDEELTDFELRGEDGVIRVHRAVLAAASPVLRRMLCGTWKETTEGHVEVQGTSQSTLQHLKDYIYLNSLPETGLEQLLLLSSYYMMPELERKCVNKIVDTLTPQNACEMLEFATRNKLTRLLLTILDSFQMGKIKVQAIWEHVYEADQSNEL